MFPLSKKMAAATMAGISLSAGMAACSATGEDDAPSPPRSTARPSPSASSPGDEPTYAEGDYSATGRYGSLPSRIDVILERTRRFDATYSRFRPDSLVSRVAAAANGGRF
jgi:hypothetical protein